ncbi:hypothetical protein [Trinickia acidisoli]|uniref:hypothetical protein n=1 Tax=Trinickia acidisoli TaxID=2767482 RepID=UPI002852E2D7|nr:hypothetical protein [Trinickia acidisoli]
MQLLTDKRENPSGSLAMQDEGFANRGHHVLALQGRLNRIAIEKKELGVGRHWRKKTMTN